MSWRERGADPRRPPLRKRRLALAAGSLAALVVIAAVAVGLTALPDARAGSGPAGPVVQASDGPAPKEDVVRPDAPEAPEAGVVKGSLQEVMAAEIAIDQLTGTFTDRRDVLASHAPGSDPLPFDGRPDDLHAVAVDVSDDQHTVCLVGRVPQGRWYARARVVVDRVSQDYYYDEVAPPPTLGSDCRPETVELWSTAGWP